MRRPCRCAAQRELDAVDALVIPGGESTTIDKLLRAFELFEPVQERLRAGMPAYGSCAGMILLADRVLGGIEGQQTLGGVDVTVRRNAFGRQVESFETDLVDRRASTGRCTRCSSGRRGSRRSVRPRTVLARVESGPAAGRIVAVRQGPLLVTSFHPEVTGDTRVHQLFVEIVRDSL